MKQQVGTHLQCSDFVSELCELCRSLSPRHRLVSKLQTEYLHRRSESTRLPATPWNVQCHQRWLGVGRQSCNSWLGGGSGGGAGLSGGFSYGGSGSGGYGGGSGGGLDLKLCSLLNKCFLLKLELVCLCGQPIAQV